MKKLIFATLLCGMTFGASAESYNRVTVSYDNEHFGYNKYAGDKDNNFSTNGFGLNYTHGFGIGEKPMFVEVGGSLDFGFNTKKGDKEEIGNDWMRTDRKSQFIQLAVPVNYVYKFNVNDDFSIAPYVGLNFKLNLVGKYKYTVESSLDLEDYGFEKEDIEGKWVNVFSDSEENMGSKEATWNRFQMGWQVGVGFQYKPFYLGIQYGTDFIPAYSQKYEFDGKKETARVSTGTLKIAVGYTF